MGHSLAGVAVAIVAMAFVSSVHAAGPWPDLPDPEFRFHTFVETRNIDTPEFFEYLRAARPEVVQVGYYGPMFHGYAYHEDATGYPMGLPTVGEREVLERHAEINRKIHELGLKVVGHFSMSSVVGSMDEPFGFIKWYNEMWDEELLGPKPVEDVRELLIRDASDNVPERRNGTFLELCISSPHTQQMMKRMVKVAIDAGVDGILTQYNYRKGCVCHWCQDEFKAYLRDRYDDAALREKFGISDLAAHTFDEIPAQIPGYPDPGEATELDWAAMEWGARHFKQVYDEVIIEHGRSLKPNLVIARWEHLGYINPGEERAFTPIGDWHRGENYFWYSGSHSISRDYSTDLDAGEAGDAWLNLLWIRAMSEGKPFMVGRYQRERIRVMLAEAVATGGGGTGRRHPFTDEVGNKVMVRHHNFVHDHRELYRAASPYAEVGLLLPRQSMRNRRPDAYDAFRITGDALLDQQVLFDVVIDERLDAERLERYRAIVLPTVLSLSDKQRSTIQQYVEAGGIALVVGEAAIMDEQGQPHDEPGVFTLDAQRRDASVTLGRGRTAWMSAEDAAAVGRWLNRLTHGAPLSEIDAPWMVRAAAYEMPGGMVLHLVNYNRDEAAAAEMKRWPAAELPIAVKDIAVELNLPRDAQVTSATLHSPDHAASIELDHLIQGGRLHLTVPEVEVYGVVEIQLAE